MTPTELTLVAPVTRHDFLAYWCAPEGWLMVPPGGAVVYNGRLVGDLYGARHSMLGILPSPTFTVVLADEERTTISGVRQIFGRVTTWAGQVFINADLRAYRSPVQIEFENADQPGDQ